MGAERPWEKSYPPGVRWDAPIETATLPALFDEFTAKWAAKPALEYRDRTTSYAELRAGVEAVASGLMDLGVGPGTSVALYLPNTPYHPLVVLRRAQGRRAHRAPLAPRCRARACPQARRTRAHASSSPPTSASCCRWRRSCKRDGLIDHLIVGDDTAFGPSAIPTTPIADGPGMVRFDKLSAAGAAKLPRQWPTVGVEDVALLQYTGGTTGKPKGAMLSHANLSAACSIYKLWGDPQRISEPGEDKVICVLPLFHIFALTAVLLRGLTGGQRAAAAPALRRGRRPSTTSRSRRRRSFRACRPCGSRSPTRPTSKARLLLAALRGLGRRRAAGRGGGAVPEADRPAPRRRLGHDGDLACRHGAAARMDRQGRLGRPAAAGHPDGHRGARRFAGVGSAPARRARSASRART